jgi:AraC-like DNA-binding protein
LWAGTIEHCIAFSIAWMQREVGASPFLFRGTLMSTAIEEIDIAAARTIGSAATSLSEATGADSSALSLSQLRETVCRIMTLLDGASKALDEHMVDPVRDSIEQAALILLREVGHPLKIAHLVSGHRSARRCELLSWQARQVFEFVEQHLSETVRVSDLSTLINLSEGHFSRAFKRRFGIPPHTYLLHRRVQRSARLMLDSRLTLSQIALNCGFSDQAHLNKVFRRLMGTTPAAWRHSNRDNALESPLRSGLSARRPSSYQDPDPRAIRRNGQALTIEA